MRIQCAFFWALFLLFELIQVTKNPIEYFFDFWNYFDMVSICFNGFIISNHVFMYLKIDGETTFGLAAIATLIMWWKLLYWFRLFDTTSFYIRLITETMKDISFFVIILMTFLLCFANCIYLLN